MSDDGIFGEDFVLDPVSYRELIVTLHCNERVIDARSVRKVFKEIMQHRILEVEDRLARNIPSIIDEVKSMR
jgi:hypothetical protein